MKKFLSILCTLMLITVSCSKQADISQTEQEIRSYTAEKLNDVANYKKQSMKVPENCNQIWSFMPYNKGEACILLGSGLRTPEFWYTSDFENYEIVEFPEFDIGKSYDLDTADDGTIVTFVNHVDYGDLEPIGLYEYPEDYDEELYDANAEYSFMIKTYKDDSLVSSANVADFGVTPEKWTAINGVYSDGETVIVYISGTFEMFNIKGEYIGELSSDIGDIDAVGKNNDGKLICSVAYKEGEADKLKMCIINPDGTLSDYNSVVYDFAETPQGIQQGAGEYDFFLWSRSTLFGIKPDGEIVSLFNINAAGFTSDIIQGFVITENGNTAVIYNDNTTWTVNFKEYIPRTQEEMDGIPVLTFGAIGGGDYILNNFVTPWNDEGHDFIFKYKDYDVQIDENGIVDMSELREDMLSGNLPDIILFNNDYNVNLAKNGALCDLYEFIDNDEEISRETFVPNVLNCFENDGKLYQLPDRFYLDAGEVAKTKFVGDGSDWNFDKYIDMIINPPVDVEIEYDSKKTRFQRYTEWIDKENATCHYDDESFVEYLEWCNIPDIIEPVYPDWENMTEEEDRNNYIRQQKRYIEDREILNSFYFGRYEDYVQSTRGEFGGEEITYLETPVLDGNNNIAITSTSEHKELAWEYIKSRISDESYEMPENGFEAPFPITKTGLKYYENFERTHYTDYGKYDETKDDPEWKDYKGIVYQLQFSIYEDCIKCGEITDEDVQAVNDLIARAEPSDAVYFPLDNSYYEIVEEESNKFFHDEITAEQCAENIQNRVSIYLSEKFS